MNRFIHSITGCHQLKERSFIFGGHIFPLCARCTGIIIGYFSYPFFVFDIIKLPFYIFLIFQIPLLLDGLIQFIFKYESKNIRRFLTGFLGGISVVGIIDLIAELIAKYIKQNLF